MDAWVAEINSKIDTAVRNVDAVVAAEKHATMSDLRDEMFDAKTKRALGLAQTSSINSTRVKEGLTKYSGPDLLLFLPDAEVCADKAFKDSERALGKMQVAITAATKRKNARDEEAKKKRKTKEGEASNKPGGNSA